MTEAHAESERPYSRKEVVEIIQSVMTSVGNRSDAAKKLHDDLKNLSDYITSMRSELAQMRSIEISHTHIPAASDELDAVVGETANATGTIMDACEKIEAIAGKMGGPEAEELTAIVTSVYEACSFQDITGQRITKVVKTLKHIESKVGEILSAFGHTAPGIEIMKPEEKKKNSPLLSGPQLGGPSVNQDDIDALLSGFDK